MATMLEAGQEMVRGERELFPIARLLGFTMTALDPGRAVFQMQVDGRHHNPLGTLHGGIYCDLADAAMGWAYGASLPEVHPRFPWVTSGPKIPPRWWKNGARSRRVSESWVLSRVMAHGRD
jgi:acyl-coenzyme A thioesterase PaaI-like protein